MSKQKTKHKILNTGLNIRKYLAGSDYQRYKSNIISKATLCKQLLLYDKVYLYSGNFIIIRLLAEWFGFDALYRLIRNGHLGFLRQKGFLAFDPKYKTITAFIVKW